MADPRFFVKAGPFTLAELALRCGGELAAGGDPGALMVDVAPLDSAGADDISFLDNKKYVGAFCVSRAGACLVHRSLACKAPAGMALLLCDDPYRAYAMVASAYYSRPPIVPGIAVGAMVDPSAIVGGGVRIEPGAVICAKAEIGAGSLIGPNAVIGVGVVLGEGCIIGAGATLSHAILGKRVNLYPGVRVGQEGFGFAMGPLGLLNVPQLGRVLIEDDVEVGANTTIDRGSGPDTIIGAGSKIDNLVQIGHNVQLGRGCVLVAQSGVAGSAHLGDFVVVGGQAGIVGHLHLGSKVRVAGQSGVMRDVEDGQTVGGSPAVPMTEWLRQSAVLGQLARKKSR